MHVLALYFGRESPQSICPMPMCQTHQQTKIERKQPHISTGSGEGSRSASTAKAYSMLEKEVAARHRCQNTETPAVNEETQETRSWTWRRSAWTRRRRRRPARTQRRRQWTRRCRGAGQRRGDATVDAGGGDRWGLAREVGDRQGKAVRRKR